MVNVRKSGKKKEEGKAGEAKGRVSWSNFAARKGRTFFSKANLEQKSSEENSRHKKLSRKQSFRKAMSSATIQLARSLLKASKQETRAISKLDFRLLDEYTSASSIAGLSSLEETEIETESEPQCSQGEKDKVKDSGFEKKMSESDALLPRTLEEEGALLPISRECLIDLMNTDNLGEYRAKKAEVLLGHVLKVSTSSEKYGVETEALRQITKWFGDPVSVMPSQLVWGLTKDKSDKEDKGGSSGSSSGSGSGSFAVSLPEPKLVRLTPSGGGQTQEEKEEAKKKAEDEKRIRRFLEHLPEEGAQGKGQEESARFKQAQWFQELGSTRSTATFTPSSRLSSSAFEEVSIERMSPLFQKGVFSRLTYRPGKGKERVTLSGFFPSGNLYFGMPNSLGGTRNEYELLGTYPKLPGFEGIDGRRSELTVSGENLYTALVNFALVCLRAQMKLPRTDIQNENVEKALLYPFTVAKRQNAHFVKIIESMILPYQQSALFFQDATLLGYGADSLSLLGYNSTSFSSSGKSGGGFTDKSLHIGKRPYLTLEQGTATLAGMKKVPVVSSTPSSFPFGSRDFLQAMSLKDVI